MKRPPFHSFWPLNCPAFHQIGPKLLNLTKAERLCRGTICFENLEANEEYYSSEPVADHNRSNMVDIIEHFWSSHPKFELLKAIVLCKPSESAAMIHVLSIEKFKILNNFLFYRFFFEHCITIILGELICTQCWQ